MINISEKYVIYNELTGEQKTLLDAAEQVLPNAYQPYSKFNVGAAIRTNTGEIILGVNVENAAYPSSMCGERSAIFSAVSQGYKNYNSIAVIVSGDKTSTSCGGCRQVINEFAQLYHKNIELIFSNRQKNQILVTSIHQLLLNPFGPNDLGIDLSDYAT